MAVRHITLKYAARCKACGNGLYAGDAVEWDSDTRAVTCRACAGARGHLRDRLKPGIGITYKPNVGSQAAHNADIASRALRRYRERSRE